MVLTFPIANKPLSNRSRTPRNRKATPKPANPTPISKKSIIRITTLYVKSCNNAMTILQYSYLFKEHNRTASLRTYNDCPISPSQRYGTLVHASTLNPSFCTTSMIDAICFSKLNFESPFP